MAVSGHAQYKFAKITGKCLPSAKLFLAELFNISSLVHYGPRN